VVAQTPENVINVGASIQVKSKAPKFGLGRLISL